MVSRSHLSPETDALLARLGVAETLPRGSSLKMCAVAEGAADLYPRLGPTRLWDTAAGTAIATEAGCDVVGLDGKPLSYDLAHGLVRPGFLVLAPGGARESCLRAPRRRRPSLQGRLFLTGRAERRPGVSPGRTDVGAAPRPPGLIAKGVAAYAGWKTIVTFWSIALSVGVSAPAGLAFGSYPAMHAARLDPVEALRCE